MNRTSALIGTAAAAAISRSGLTGPLQRTAACAFGSCRKANATTAARASKTRPAVVIANEYSDQARSDYMKVRTYELNFI